MLQNPGRYLTLTIALIVISLLSMLIPDRPFRLGLDLRGGTRLVYRFDFQKAVAEGKLSEADLRDPEQLLRDTQEIIRNRIDPDGLLEASILPQGSDRLVIELPGEALARVQASAELAGEMSRNAATAQVAVSEEVLKSFPATGGVVGIGGEKVRYGRRDGDVLADLKRGLDGTAQEAHPAGTEITLLSDDQIRILIENTGEMQFFIRARPTDFPPTTDESREQQKLRDWIEKNPNAELADFNRLPADQGGPMENLRWFPRRVEAGQAVPPLAQRDVQPLIVQPPQWRFSGDDLDTVGLSTDDLGFPAVSFRFKTAKRQAFGEFTAAHVNDGMAIVLNDEIVTLATINEKLPGQGIINGGRRGFKLDEVKDLIAVLRSGSLRIRPELEQEERIGATLGEDYVRTGVISCSLSLLLVMVFMIGYYRRLGIYASASLLLNLVLLLGALAFLRATLTLPGIAGLILTVGMAVDSNIIIYERIREELQRGLKVGQAAKNGFDVAFSTIFDMNVTTLLSGIVLLNFGTGAVRGFATTLVWGILTTLFSVLIGTKLMVHWAVERGAKDFKMAQLVRDTKISFMGMARIAIPISALLVLASIAFFAALPDRVKLSIDFLGGITVTARTEEPQPVDRIRELIRGIGGTIGESADVKAVLASGDGERGYTTFRVTYKLGGEADETTAQETGERAIKDALAPVLQSDPVQIQLGGEEAAQSLSGRLYFEERHPTDDIQAVLAEAGLSEPKVQEVAERAGVYTFEAQNVSGTARSPSAWTTRIATIFGTKTDSTGAGYSLANPLPDTSVVGAQVSGELRDKAVQAVLLSLLATILYIRVRFKEYSYGLAIAIALAHDVAITLGALSLVNWLGWIEGEINLAMIAALLTIIGWSQNDTIVIFDRIRENLPRTKGTLKEILDLSINQTLSRTLLTSLTVLISVLVLFLFNVGTRNVLEGFTFAMIVGVIAGTYSTIFIASPFLHWMETRAQRKAEAEKASGGARAA